MSGTAVNDAAQIDPVERAREQRGWYWYDFANSAFVTTTATVLAGPYLTAVAKTAACGTSEGDCAIPLRILGIDVSAGSLYFYAITLTTILSAFVLPVVGAIADRSARKKRLLAGFAWAGSFFAALLFFVTGGNWQLGVVAMMAASLCLGASLVVYDAILIEIATPDERDRVSSRGWAFGYVGGAVLLIVNFGVLFVINNAIGLITPPVGTVLNVVCGVSKLSMEEIMKGVWPFMVAQLLVLLLLVLFPALVTVPAAWFAR